MAPLDEIPPCRKELSLDVEGAEGSAREFYGKGEGKKTKNKDTDFRDMKGVEIIIKNKINEKVQLQIS